MIKPKVYVHGIADGKFGVFVEGHCLGYSKTDSDARFHMHFLVQLLENVQKEAFDEGRKSELPKI